MLVLEHVLLPRQQKSTADTDATPSTGFAEEAVSDNSRGRYLSWIMCGVVCHRHL